MKISFIVIGIILVISAVVFYVFAVLPGASVVPAGPSAQPGTNEMPPAAGSPPAATSSTSVPAPGKQPLSTVTGVVMMKDSNTLLAPANHFVLSGGLTVIVENSTSTDTKIVNTLGKEVGNNFIQVGNMVTVTGVRSGSTIHARLIQVQTRKDEGA